jgi:hypothetical protein
MVLFVIGAMLGGLQLLLCLRRRPAMEHPIAGIATSLIFGAIVYGTILWLFARFVVAWASN